MAYTGALSVGELDQIGGMLKKAESFDDLVAQIEVAIPKINRTQVNNILAEAIDRAFEKLDYSYVDTFNLALDFRRAAPNSPLGAIEDAIENIAAEIKRDPNELRVYSSWAEMHKPENRAKHGRGHAA